MAFEHLEENTQFGKESASELITETLLITTVILLSVYSVPDALCSFSKLFCSKGGISTTFFDEETEVLISLVPCLRAKS